MKSFRNPKYLERYEDVFFELETPLNTGDPGNNNSQKKTGYRFVVDNTGGVTPFDWYNARISLDFKGAIHLNAIFPPLDMALTAISHSRFKQSKNPIIIP